MSPPRTHQLVCGYMTGLDEGIIGVSWKYNIQQYDIVGVLNYFLFWYKLGVWCIVLSVPVYNSLQLSTKRHASAAYSPPPLYLPE